MGVRHFMGVIVRMDVKLPTRDALASAARKVEMDGLPETEAGDRGLEDFFVDPKIPKCPHGHVTTYARKAVQIERAHEWRGIVPGKLYGELAPVRHRLSEVFPPQICTNQTRIEEAQPLNEPKQRV
jgi:hypothetical protein